MTTVQLPEHLHGRTHEPWCREHGWDKTAGEDFEAYLSGPVVGWGFCSSGDLFRVGSLILDVNDGGEVDGVPAICLDTTELTMHEARELAARLLEAADMLNPGRTSGVG